MGIESVVTDKLSYDLFSVLVRALNVELVVIGSDPGVEKKFSPSELVTVGCWCTYYYLKTIFSSHVKT
jgi:hypothetical protein